MLRRFVLSLLVLGLPAFPAGELSNRRAPGFALPDHTVLKVHDLADYRGRVVLLEIMQTSCPNCQVLSQTLERVKAKYGDRIAVLSIVNPPDNTASVGRYIVTQKVTSPVLFDCGQVSASYLKITPSKPSIHVPHLFLIDQNGNIRNDWEHSTAAKAIFEGTGLHAEIDRLLGTPAKAVKSTR